MHKPEDEVVIDIRTSCTKDEAVAKLLGWLQSPIQKRHVDEEDLANPITILQKELSLSSSLVKILSDLREEARGDFLDAVDSGEPETTWEKSEKIVIEYDDLIKKAHGFMMDIDDELSSEYSKLKIDQSRTESTGVIHITLRSLDKWARAQYNIGILDSPLTKTIYTTEEDDCDCKGGLTKTKADHIFTTFAFLTELLARTSPKYQYGDAKKPNIDLIAKSISELADASISDQLKFQGQGPDVIKTRLDQAFDTKLKKLLKYTPEK